MTTAGQTSTLCGGHAATTPPVLIAFGLIEHKGHDLRDVPLLHRKMKLRKVLSKTLTGIQFNEHFTDEGETVFRHIRRLGLEVIVSKRIDVPYRSGPSKVWLKSKNRSSEAVRREAEEDWNASR